MVSTKLLETAEKLSERAMFLLQSSKPKVKGFDEKFIMKVVEGLEGKSLHV